MPVFGRAARAQFLTIGANPSADDIRCGNWQPDSDLAAQCLDYFHSSAVRPHPFFSDWETALSALTPCRFSYRENLAHLDLSPRPTKSLRAINKSDQDKKVFMAMLKHDSKYLFSVLAIVWPNLRGVFAAGTVTDDWYIDELLKRHGKSFGIRFQRPHVLPAKANSQRANPKLYGVTFSGASKPLFFCPVGASADRPGDKERFYAQFADNAEFLRPILCPAAKA